MYNTLIHMPTLARSDCSGPGLEESRSGLSVRVNNVLRAFYMYNTLIHMPTLARSDCSGSGLKNQDQV